MFKKIFSDSEKKEKSRQTSADSSFSSLSEEKNKTLHSSSKEKSSAEISKESSQNTNVHSTHEFTRVIEEEDTLVLENKKRSEYPASLVMLSGPKDLIGMSWILEKPLIGVGRSSRLNDISVPYESLSKSHFQIIREGKNFYVLDLKSTNQTYLDDNLLKPYQKTPLKNNAYIKASSLIFKFLDEGNIETFSSQEVLSKAQTDSLTGVGNRSLLKVKGTEYFLNKSQPLSLIVFDIDDFKFINDSLGHLAGDYVLKSLSQCVLQLIRKGDVFIRYGGDEFCLLTPYSFSSAVSIASRIEKEIENYSFTLKGQKISVGISIGWAERLETDRSLEDIYHRADKMSYENKKKKKSLKLQNERNDS